MKKLCIILTITISLIILSSGYSMACHEEAMGGEGGIWPTLRGHNPTTRSNGLLVFTESTTAVTSTSTSCDEYTSFLEKSYDQIAENAARGEGIFLDALSSFHGCPSESINRFQHLVRENYRVLFKNHKKNGTALGMRLEIVLNSDKKLRNKCSRISALI